jgi:hypothetical protein
MGERRPKNNFLRRPTPGEWLAILNLILWASVIALQQLWPDSRGWDAVSTWLADIALFPLILILLLAGLKLDRRVDLADLWLLILLNLGFWWYWLPRLYSLFISLTRGARIQRLKDEGRCIYCGYDLRATPDRCPECGAAGEVKTGRKDVRDAKENAKKFKGLD